jgi:energy-coupling factor transport system permease protein
VLASFSYRPRNSLVETFDPRARWVFSILALSSIILFWDIRFLLFFFLLSLVQFHYSNLTWKETRKAWLLILVLTTTMVLFNTILTGAGTVGGVISQGTPVLQFDLHMPLTHWHIQYVLTRERLWFALAQYLRVLAIAGLFIVIPFTMAPQIYGATFKGIGLPDKLAYTIDLSFRFVPTLVRDFQTTLDAQRARGFEVDRVDGGLFARIRRTAPLFVPVTMNAILSGEDIANAMDLRCFGLRKRTWVEALKFSPRDYALLAFSLALLVLSLVLRLGFGIGNFWIPT